MTGIYLLVLVLLVPFCRAEQFHFFTRGESTGVTFDTGDGKRDELNCYILPPVSSRRETVNEVSVEELNRIKKYCGNKKRSITANKRAIINIIAPGTKWCGTGSVAKNDADLGSKPVTDACCRTHDKCTPKINGFGRKGTFINLLPWTRLHCDCDNAFHTCLKNAKKTEKSTADLVGIAYFNVLATKCFKEHSWRICIKFGWFKCKEYKYFNTYKWVSTKSY